MPEPMTIAALIGAGLGYLSSRSANAASVREAQKNREFQERMSSTAHQREVADLRAAGINPMVRHMSGASSPGGAVADVRDVGEGAGRGLASALAIKQMQANLKLTSAQADREAASAVLANQQAQDIWVTQQGRLSLTDAQAAVANASVEQQRALLPMVLAKAKEEVLLTASSARAAEARAALDELAKSGAMNVAEFEKRIGEKGPWVKLLFELVRTVK